MNEIKSEKAIGTGDWIVNILLASIPIVNIFLLFYWAFNYNTNRNKANWAKALLIIYAAIICVGALLAINLYQHYIQLNRLWFNLESFLNMIID